MTKTEFDAILKDKLKGLPKEDIDSSVDYYNEMIDERTDDGLSEEDAVAAIGSVDEIVSGILADTPLPKLIKQKVASGHTMRTWEIILLVLGSPVWLSLLIAAAAVVLSIYVVLWTVVITFYAAAISFAASSLAGIAAAVIFAIKGNVISGVFIAGCGIVCAGLAILTFLASNQAAKYVAILGKKILRGIKLCIVGKGRVQ